MMDDPFSSLTQIVLIKPILSALIDKFIKINRFEGYFV